MPFAATPRYMPRFTAFVDIFQDGAMLHSSVMLRYARRVLRPWRCGAAREVQYACAAAQCRQSSLKAAVMPRERLMRGAPRSEICFAMMRGHDDIRSTFCDAMLLRGTRVLYIRIRFRCYDADARCAFCAAAKRYAARWRARYAAIASAFHAALDRVAAKR